MHVNDNKCVQSVVSEDRRADRSSQVNNIEINIIEIE
jgi:hypothetical protein